MVAFLKQVEAETILKNLSDSIGYLRSMTMWKNNMPRLQSKPFSSAALALLLRTCLSVCRSEYLSLLYLVSLAFSQSITCFASYPWVGILSQAFLLTMVSAFISASVSPLEFSAWALFLLSYRESVFVSISWKPMPPKHIHWYFFNGHFRYTFIVLFLAMILSL